MVLQRKDEQLMTSKSTMQLSIKATLQAFGAKEREIRRFPADDNVLTSMDELLNKIRQSFADIDSTDLTIYWQGKRCNMVIDRCLDIVT